MTVKEIEKILDEECHKYPFCSKGCPLHKCGHDCTRINDDDCTQEEAELLYNIMFPPGESKDNPVTHPSHYTQGNIQCIDAMEAAFGKEAVATWSKLNAFKYIWRAVHKNGMEDIDKAIWYLNKHKELMSNEQTEAV